MEENAATNRVLLVGGGAREHAIGAAIAASRSAELYTVAHNHNPGLVRLSREFALHDEKDVLWVAEWAKSHSLNLAVIGLEDPLSLGIADALWDVGIPTVGPRREAARLESSKLFTRELMLRHQIPGRVEHHYFSDPIALEQFMRSSDRLWALKPVGLTAGQGVKLMGDQLPTLADALAYGKQVISEQIGGTPGIILEELLRGPEFTLQCFVDGKTVVPMPLVRDYKRAFDGDLGPNTGSMGSYSLATGLLPFVSESVRDEALSIVTQITDAVLREGFLYQGIMYGQFIMTGTGIRLIEINARFGDPEAVNVLPLLEGDFVEICRAITTGELRPDQVRFRPLATICKYVTPPGYGVAPEAEVALEVDERAIADSGVYTFYAKVDERDGRVFTTRSRSIALLGVGSTPGVAESAVEDAVKHIGGRFHIRHDIGKQLDSPVPQVSLVTSI